MQCSMVVQEAVTKIAQLRVGVGQLKTQLGHDGLGQHQALCMGHVARFGHQGGTLDRIPKDVDIALEATLKV